MALYTVLTPCVVGTRHYATVPNLPINADPADVVDLLKSGAVAPYPPAAKAKKVDAVVETVDEEPAVPVVRAAPLPRRRRKG